MSARRRAYRLAVDPCHVAGVHTGRDDRAADGACMVDEERLITRAGLNEVHDLLVPPDGGANAHDIGRLRDRPP